MSASLRFFAWLPIALIVVPLLAFAIGWHLSPALIIFALLIGLMLTGMPISIALGLTVLTFLFTMTTGADHSRGVEAVHRHRTLRGDGDPVLHPRRQLPDAWRRRAADDQLRLGVRRTLARRPRTRWRHGVRPVRCGFGFIAGDCRRHRFDPAACHDQAGISQALRRRRDHDLGRAGHPDSAIDRDGDVLGRDQYVSRGNCSWPASSPASSWRRCSVSRPGGARARTTIRGWPKASWGERWRTFRESVWGLLLIVVVIGGIYTGVFTPTEAAAMSAVYAFFVAVFVYKDLTLAKVPKVLLDSANMSAMLLYIITNAVLFSFLMTSEQIPQANGAVDARPGLGRRRLPAGGQSAAAARRQRHGAVVDRADHGAHPVSGRDEARHRPGPLRHHHDGQHGSRHVPPAGRPQPLRRAAASPKWASPN